MVGIFQLLHCEKTGYVTRSHKKRLQEGSSQNDKITSASEAAK